VYIIVYYNIKIEFSIICFVFSQASDVFVAFLFYFEGQYYSAALTLAFVCLPGINKPLFNHLYDNL